MRRVFRAVGILAVLALGGQAGAQEDDPIAQAMKVELSRGMEGLRLPGLSSLHHLGYWMRDQREITIQASAGSLTRSTDLRSRQARIDVRVGEPALDSSGFYPKDRSLSTSPMVELPLDGDAMATRRILWYQTDRLYKSAAQSLEAKRAFLAQKMGELRAPDFAPEPPVTIAIPHERAVVDVRGWEERVRDLSAILRRYPAIIKSDVVFFTRDRTEIMVNSEGSDVRHGDVRAGVEVSAEALASDGMTVQDFAIVYGEGLGDAMPAFAKEVEAMASRLTRRLAARVGDDYLGPVIFERQAACELLGQLLAPAIAADKPVIYEDERFGTRSQGPAFGNRLNRRVLPTFLSVVDDPQAKEIAGARLLGGYAVDQEGIPPRRVNLVEHGILKGLLVGRSPHEKILKSNGHARAESGLPGSRISNLIVKNDEPMSGKKLRRELIDLVKAQDLGYGIIVRKCNDELLESRQGRSGNRLTSPLEVFRLYADGREEEVRGLYFGDIGVRVLRDILAAGEEPYVYNYYQSGRGGTVLCSITSPALLLEEVELKAMDRGQDRPPVLPSPLSLAQGPPSKGDDDSRETE